MSGGEREARQSAEKDAGRPCYRCGKDPAEGYASVWTAAEGERWYCHGDDDDVTCYIADGHECADYAEFLRMVDGDQPIDTVTWSRDTCGRFVVRWTPLTRVLPPGGSDA